MKNITLIEEKIKTISCDIDIKISSRTSKTIAFVLVKSVKILMMNHHLLIQQPTIE